MKKFQNVSRAWICLLLVAASAAPQSHASEAGKFPEFRDVVELIRSHMTGVTEEELNRAAVKGLIAGLGGKAELVGANEQRPGAEPKPLLTKKEIYDGNFGYLRVAQVRVGLQAEMESALAGLGATNRLRGLVIDLRYAEGDDYAAVVEAADPFFASEQLLLTWDGRKGFSTEKQHPIKLPLAVLVNPETRGAAEALAAVLKEAGALLIGGRTAGLAHVAKEYPLNEEYRLRLAGGTVEAGEHLKLTGSGVVPDIAIEVSREDEKVYFEDAYAVVSRLSGSRANERAEQRPARRINEAELVRMQREGYDLNPPTRSEPEVKPVVTDPSLGRALDFLKGLAALQSRS